MKLAILLAFSLIFASCGRKTGPNSQKPRSGAASTSKAAAGDNNKELLKCDQFAHDNDIVPIRSINIKVELFNYKLSVSPVLLNYANLKLQKTCVHNQGKWAEINPIESKKIDESNIEVLNEACKKLTEDEAIKKTLKAANDIIADVPQAKNFNGGFLIRVDSTANKELLNKTYRCNHTLLNIKK